ncbi:MAG TPA: fumarylacetoacetate hydrolase family protein [Saprospiraceae bacterium]|nr:fumarylacetoacetate hydrolase family protein [Saprospiraceae bacterium]
MKIFCIGRNYAEHAKELGNAIPSEPMIFMKPATALVVNNKPFYYPDFSKDIQYEAEIVLRISKNGKQVQPEFASEYYDAVAIGIDFTARDLQQRCKENRTPWEIAKAFDNSAPVSDFIPLNEAMTNGSIDFHLDINGQTVQHGDTKNVIFDFDTLICHISKYFKVQQGDYVFTGTPEGVGPVKIGDVLEGYIGSRKLMQFEVK